MVRKVVPVPEAIDIEVASWRLEAFGRKIDKLSPSQRKYLKSWTL